MQLEGEEHADIPPLKDLAALDACITVVDAANLMANLKSIQTLKVWPRLGSGMVQLCSCHWKGVIWHQAPQGFA